MKRLEEIRQYINDPNVAWNEKAEETARELLAMVDKLREDNSLLQSVASNGWIEAWHCGNGFMALPPQDDHGTVVRCWGESQTLKQLQRFNSGTLVPDLVQRAVKGLKHIGRFPARTDPHPLDCTLAGRVSHVFCIGMTRAVELCRKCGENPEFYERAEMCRDGEGHVSHDYDGVRCRKCGRLQKS